MRLIFANFAKKPPEQGGCKNRLNNTISIRISLRHRIKNIFLLHTQKAYFYQEKEQYYLLL